MELPYKTRSFLFWPKILFLLSLANAAQAENAITYAPVICGHPTTLILDTHSLEEALKPALPEHFRSTDELGSAKINNKTGLETLHLAGGAQFSGASLKAIQKTLPKLQYDIDLRREPHAFINEGIPISLFGHPHDWSNTCKAEHHSAEANFMAFLESHLFEKIQLIYGAADSAQGLRGGKPLILSLQSAEDEKTLTHKQKISYFHVLAADHLSPTQKESNQFIEIIRKIPVGGYTYLHCHAGEGRTSTFMVMLDMMRNAKQVSFDDILQRQMALGSIDLLNTQNSDTYKQGPAKKRLAFLRAFYLYCKNNQDDFKTPFYVSRT